MTKLDPLIDLKWSRFHEYSLILTYGDQFRVIKNNLTQDEFIHIVNYLKSKE